MVDVTYPKNGKSIFTKVSCKGIIMKKLREMVQRLRQKTGFTEMTEINPRLAGMERVFHAPPMTPELLAAIKLISHHFEFTTSEKSRLVWEADQNGACWGEYEALVPLFRSIPKPNKILEIVPGMGRSLVFLSRNLAGRTARSMPTRGKAIQQGTQILVPVSMIRTAAIWMYCVTFWILTGSVMSPCSMHGTL